MAMGTGIDSVLNYDLREEYRQYLTSHLRELGMNTEDIILNLGKDAGNLLSLPLSRIALQPMDMLISGPPCPPWAGQGKKGGLNDPRALVFIRILQWAVVMIKCCGLLGLVLENVVGITYEVDGREAVATRFINLMRTLCPEFCFTVDILKAVDYMCPQTRVRVFIRGFRRCISETVPPVLPGFGSRGLRTLLGKFPITPRESLTLPQQDNLKQIEQRLRICFQSLYICMYAYIYIYDPSVRPQILLGVLETLNPKP